jgi:hypothetical protein
MHSLPATWGMSSHPGMMTLHFVVSVKLAVHGGQLIRERRHACELKPNCASLVVHVHPTSFP